MTNEIDSGRKRVKVQMGVLIFIMDETLRKKFQVSWIFTGSLCNIRVLTIVACIEIKNDEGGIRRDIFH